MPHPTPSALYRAALAAAERGWHVFPLAPGGKRPAVKAWEQRATTDPDRIARCWAVGDHNVGIATGPSALVVVDLDTPKPGEAAPAEWRLPGITAGADVLAALAERHGQPYPHDTYTVRTAGGGAHLYFTAPAGTDLRNTAGRLGWKIDTRAGGGYVVAAGSRVADGRTYTVVHDAPPAPLPAWLGELLAPAPLPPQQPITVPLAASDRRTRYVRAAVRAELERVTRAREGQRNTALYRASVALGQLVAGRALGSEVADWLTAAAVQGGQNEREVRRTIASGMRAGARRPREVAA
ncbi:bifunctional DNA primase/polymerase [Streptomyces sp. JJ36]|uniref:bifunctional DNA primase/polymerase n=1 Tax=Streptomyces sp. JJ36 TaxID=2736645 RepID=UPI001F27E2FC|nr:bifunctional DNA primase/polymerase [Streptomyces sp. JJ36]MCF6525666.1 bifunctional DNA primase/polymerase [Streptomyces sp. JJ36]